MNGNAVSAGSAIWTFDQRVSSALSRIQMDPSCVKGIGVVTSANTSISHAELTVSSAQVSRNVDPRMRFKKYRTFIACCPF